MAARNATGHPLPALELGRPRPGAEDQRCQAQEGKADSPQTDIREGESVEQVYVRQGGLPSPTRACARAVAVLHSS